MSIGGRDEAPSRALSLQDGAGLGDVQAIRRGRVGRRIARRVGGKATGRVLGRIFRASPGGREWACDAPPEEREGL
jgi:hypothetical protein